VLVPVLLCRLRVGVSPVVDLQCAVREDKAVDSVAQLGGKAE
jgi:hypothetical protein